jgi:hypothetical protein
MTMTYALTRFNTHRSFNLTSTKPSLSSRNMAIIASQPQPQPQPQYSTAKTGKNPDYRNSQVGQRLPKGKPELGIGHLSAGPAAGSYPNINYDQQDQRTTDPRYPSILGANCTHPLTAAKCQAASGLVDATVLYAIPSLQQNTNSYRLREKGRP